MITESIALQEKKFSNSKLLGVIQLQYRSLKNHFIESRSKRKALYNIIRKEQPNIIHHNNEIFLNRNAIRAGIKAKVKQVLHERFLGNYGNNYINLFADKILMKKTAARIDITKAVAVNFDKLYPATANHKIILHES
jgi:hypothetical protein